MERKAADLPGPPPPPTSLAHPIAEAAAAAASANTCNNLTSSSSSSSSSSLSRNDFLREVNAIFKRRQPLDNMPSSFSRASRILVSSQTEQSKSSTNASSVISGDASKKSNQAGRIMRVERLPNLMLDRRKDGAAEVMVNPTDDSSLTTPWSTGTITTVRDEKMSPFAVQKDEVADRKKTSVAVFSSQIASQLASTGDELKMAQFSLGGRSSPFQSVDARMTTDTRMDDISSYLHSLALTEAESCLTSAAANNQDPSPRDAVSMVNFGTRASLLEKRDESRDNQQYVDPVTRCSVVGSSCATTMSLHSGPTFQSTRAPMTGQSAFPTGMSSSALDASLPNMEHSFPDVLKNERKEGAGRQDFHQGLHLGESVKEKEVSGNVSCLQPRPPLTNKPSTNIDTEPSQPGKSEKVSRKKKYDPDVFFKVNGKLYQKLGKIGSGGSSEVHKVISSDCTIYALKKIKLKGRDYPTAYGFCQEIEYLNKLKGKNNIIQLIDYEVTDEALLQEVVNGSMTVKEGRIKDDQYIYMVLEYGEIDLAHMLSQKRNEMDNSNGILNENWLRFYWQQMLEAVNTIHEERIVHSDLKPANFLLVRGSLKLIDFGIAKAIMSDTTNIQRDAQVGTLNYMSPEAFMWNEHDANGNTIKSGRPSDIWSLGCILYQMVYGKTPFAEYKTFWAKFKVITDRNHKIVYEPVSNPWLIDLMQRCLAWDRNERWRIPQLLHHPFLVPPIALELPSPREQSCKLLMQKVEMYRGDPEVSRLCSELIKTITRLEQNQSYQDMNA